jgi:hypothetical protein
MKTTAEAESQAKTQSDWRWRPAGFSASRKAFPESLLRSEIGVFNTRIAGALYTSTGGDDPEEAMQIIIRH